MDKVNFKKELAQLYNPKNTDWELVEVPAMNFLMIDGKGDPNTAEDYSDAVEALYSAAYAIKIRSRRTLGRDYVVPPLEGLWSADDPTAFTNADKGKYQWTMMIMQPDWITQKGFLALLTRYQRESSCQLYPKYDLNHITRAYHCNCYMSALTTPRRQNSNISMPNTCRRTI